VILDFELFQQTAPADNRLLLESLLRVEGVSGRTGVGRPENRPNGSPNRTPTEEVVLEPAKNACNPSETTFPTRSDKPFTSLNTPKSAHTPKKASSGTGSG
jgi:hypothetical protein